MPARGNRGRGGRGGGRGGGQQGGANHSDTDDDERRRRRRGLPVLSQWNYDKWDNRVGDLAYTRDWSDVYEYALPADGNRGAAANAPAMDDDLKRKMWGLIKDTLDDDMVDVVMDVDRGDLIDLLRSLRDHFYKHNAQNKDRIKRQINECKLSEYKDVEAYIARIKTLIKKAESFGGAWDYDDKRFAVLEGLPGEYDQMKTAVKMPRNPPLTWLELLEQIRDAASNDGMPGNRYEAAQDTVLWTNDNKKRQQERNQNKKKGKICYQFRDHGKCTRNNCNFAHVKKCTHCSKEGHWKADCFQLQKQRKKDGANAAKEKDEKDDDADDDSDLAFSVVEHTEGRDIEHVNLSAECARMRLTPTSGVSFTLDSAATCNIVDPLLVKDGALITNVRKVKRGIEVGGGIVHACNEIADVSIVYKHGTKTRKLMLKDARIVKGFGKNLMSEAKMMEAGFEFRKMLVGKVGMQSVRKDGKEVMCLRWQGDKLFTLDALTRKKHVHASKQWNVVVAEAKNKHMDSTRVAYEIIDQCHMTRTYAPGVSDLELWHRRLGHRNFRDVAKLLGIKLPKNYKSTFCEACVQGKAKAHPRGTKLTNLRPLLKSKRSGQVWHSDVAGPYRTPTLGGARYLCVLVDDFSRRIRVKLLKSTGEFTEVWRNFILELEAELGSDRVVMMLRTDGAKYYDCKALAIFCKGKGIQLSLSPRGTPQLNSVAEKALDVVMSMARTLSLQGGAPDSYWGYSALHAGRILELCPRSYHDVEGKLTPLQRWHGDNVQVNYAQLHTLYCAAYKLMPGQVSNYDKLRARAEKYTYVGWSLKYQTHALMSKSTNKLYHSADVIFNEASFPLRADDPYHRLVRGNGEQPRAIENLLTSIARTRPRREAQLSHEALQAIASEADYEDVFGDPDLALSSSEVVPPAGAAPEAATDIHTHTQPLTASALRLPEPTTYAQTQQSPYKQDWNDAMEDEITKLNGLDCWTLVPRKIGKKVMGTKWVYKVKYRPENPSEIEKFKARLCIQGFGLEQWSDYGQVRAPTVHPDTVKLFFFLLMLLKLLWMSLDISSFFLYGEPAQVYYCEQAPGFVEKGKEDHVCMCNKTIYGTPDAPYEAQKKLDAALNEAGYVPAHGDGRLFYKRCSDGLGLIINHVDDCGCGFSNEKMKQDWLTVIGKHFKYTSHDEPGSFTGLIIDRDVARGVLKLTQAHRVMKLVEEMGLTDANPTKTPGSPQPPGGATEDDRETSKEYMSVTGKLIWLVSTRPDIAFAVNMRCRHMQKSNARDMLECKRIARYLKGTAEMGLTFNGADGNIKIFGMSDASFADAPRARSSGGYVVGFGTKENIRGVFIAKAFTQRLVALSTAESELISVAELCKAVIWARDFLAELGFPQEEATPVYTDNMAVIQIIADPTLMLRSRHYRARSHFVRDLVLRQVVELIHVESKENVADILTKALPIVQHAYLRGLIME